jgi:polyhydroxybutyrate depolymerase
MKLYLNLKPESYLSTMKNLIRVLAVIAFASGIIHAEVITDSIRIGNNYRSFHFQKPASYEPGNSLVFILHGSGGNGLDMMSRTGRLAEQAERENALLVYPNGYKKYWNECRKAASSLANQENIDEAAFFTDMIKYFIDKYEIDDRRIFAIGTSGGGHMCYKLALTMPEKFAAVAALIASLPDDENMDCPESGVAIPVMIVNGTADPVNPYEGGLMKGGNFVMGTVRSTEMTFQYWARLARYEGNPLVEPLPDNDPSDGKVIERYVYKSHGKPEIVLLKVIGGKHDYPNDIDVHVEGWEFFKRQIK